MAVQMHSSGTIYGIVLLCLLGGLLQSQHNAKPPAYSPTGN